MCVGEAAEGGAPQAVWEAVTPHVKLVATIYVVQHAKLVAQKIVNLVVVMDVLILALEAVLDHVLVLQKAHVAVAAMLVCLRVKEDVKADALVDVKVRVNQDAKEHVLLRVPAVVIVVVKRHANQDAKDLAKVVEEIVVANVQVVDLVALVLVGEQ